MSEPYDLSAYLITIGKRPCLDTLTSDTENPAASSHHSAHIKEYRQTPGEKNASLFAQTGILDRGRSYIFFNWRLVAFNRHAADGRKIVQQGNIVFHTQFHHR